MEHLAPGVRGRWEVLARCVSLVVNGAVGMGRVDAERAGIVMVRD